MGVPRSVVIERGSAYRAVRPLLVAYTGLDLRCVIGWRASTLTAKRAAAVKAGAKDAEVVDKTTN